MRQSLLLGALAEVAELHLAMFDLDVNAAPPFPAKLTPLPAPPHTKPGTLGLLLGDLSSPLPRMVRGYDLSGPRTAVANLRPESFDAMVAFRIDFAHWAGVLDHPRLILDIDDPEHIRAQRRIIATTGHNGDWRTRLDLAKLRRFEHQAVAKAQISFVCQENDRKGWPRQPLVVPNCVQVPSSPPRNVTEPKLIFVGNCAAGDTSPNVDAVRYFLREIWPLVQRQVPAARFEIVGAVSETVRAAAAAASHVTVRGFVENLDDVYATASASVVPIRFGTGTRVKIIDAFAHACPVVSTTAGAEGIDAVPGRDLELADAPAEFAAHCAALLMDAAAQHRIGWAGYALASQRYDRQAQKRRLAEIFNRFLASADPASAGAQNRDAANRHGGDKAAACA